MELTSEHRRPLEPGLVWACSLPDEAPPRGVALQFSRSCERCFVRWRAEAARNGIFQFASAEPDDGRGYVLHSGHTEAEIREWYFREGSTD